MNKVTESIYGLVGYPVAHSLSPFMHNTAFAELGMDATYRLFSLKEDELDGFFLKLRERESPIKGLNVTIPYKEKVIKYLDALSPFAQKTMAVNTIVFTGDRKFTGFNSDGPGFLAHLTELGVKTEGKNVALLGCGGAARAIVSVLCLLPERTRSIRIYDVAKEKAQILVDDLKTRLDASVVEVVNSIDDLAIDKSDILINATPIGMKPEDPCLVDESLLHKDMFVYDLIYNPAETKLLKLAKQKGAKTSNGLGMLFYQGTLAFLHWTGIELEKKVKNKMWESLKKGAHG